MNVKETLFRKRQAAALLRERRRAAGMCVDCGQYPPSMNQDRTLGVRCTECRKRGTGRTRSRFRGKNGGDGFTADSSSEGYLETREFQAFCRRVKAVLADGRAMTIGDLRRALGEDLIDHWLCDAIDDLVGDGAIEEVYGVPSRWQQRKGYQPRRKEQQQEAR